MKELEARLAFIRETDKMKYVIRQTPVGDRSRCENDAEHSFSFALMAMTLAPYAPVETNLSRVIRMALVHDLVEIYAGDTYIYDKVGNSDKAQRETDAAEKLFSLLPKEQGDEFCALWREFDAEETPDARFAACIDRFQPLFMNYETGGISWKKHGICRAQVEGRMALLKRVTPALYDKAQAMLDSAVEQGWLLA